ncbi:DNA phosphorothioation-dependent restriction protein DptF [Pseudoalteromonas distincta]|uniref:DNA phosphorothioation-dependent restriction protein DptF n=1 Tax=Pseudoalteromonas distincta TaxID=77608 RepID=UPI0032187D6D
MRLKEALGVLSKASPYAVSTIRKGKQPDEYKYKEYLYVEPEIATDFERKLVESNDNTILFLCGSSGDGKSEVLTRLCNKLEFQNIVFHLDATHGKTQHGTAVDSLNELFDTQKKQQCKLAVGINIGMFQKFIKFGSERHRDIKNMFTQFLKNRHEKGFQCGNAVFYDFETYPRLDFTKGRVESEFVARFLQALTSECDENPFHSLYIYEKKVESQLAFNFQLLREKDFQNALIYLFGVIRLYNEQFLVPRLFVDFIYQLLTAENKQGLIGNLFTHLDNQISEKIVLHDPLSKSNEVLDSFFLEYVTDSLSHETIKSINYLTKLAGCELENVNIARLAWVMNKEISQKFPNSKLVNLFPERSSVTYLDLYQRLVKNKFDHNDEDYLVELFEKNILESILNYINRKVPAELNGFVISRELNDFVICNKLEVELDLEYLEEKIFFSPDLLEIKFIVNQDVELFLNLDIKVFTLIQNIKNGYLPNRSLHNEFTKLDEFIRELINATSKTKEIRVFDKQGSDNLIAEAKKGRRGYTVSGSIF